MRNKRRKPKMTTGICTKVPSWTMKKGYDVLGYSPIEGEKYKFEFKGTAYHVHGLWMPEMCYSGRPSKTYLVVQSQNIKGHWEGSIIEDIKERHAKEIKERDERLSKRASL